MFLADFGVIREAGIPVSLVLNACLETDDSIEIDLVDLGENGYPALIIKAMSQIQSPTPVPSAEWMLIDVPEDVVCQIKREGISIVDLETDAFFKMPPIKEEQGRNSLEKVTQNYETSVD